jgi:hypothetical protein
MDHIVGCTTLDKNNVLIKLLLEILMINLKIPVSFISHKSIPPTLITQCVTLDRFHAEEVKK